MHVNKALWSIENSQEKEDSLARMIQAAASALKPDLDLYGLIL
jgi:hypothetical protein